MYSACADHLKKTRTLVHDAKHRYQIFVLGPQEKVVDDGADVIEYALRICVAHAAVEEVDLSERARVVIAWGKCG
jgi:coenzyme F420-reducing hydrogenase gamma subunit